MSATSAVLEPPRLETAPLPQTAAGERYIALRYGPVRLDAELAELRKSVREFRPA